MLDKSENCGIMYLVPYAGIAHPVERHLAKVEVASSSLVARSIKTSVFRQRFYFFRICIFNKIKNADFKRNLHFGRSGET